ncbi:hypothetical protein ABN028_10955 [Actinopolymorpha sp. B17G11]|uniref:hypothetical protein n=1 Tax=Actinopolymorpha sp. B17G11 TaxID=3160861 RepID=UPI0032E4A1F6
MYDLPGYVWAMTLGGVIGILLTTSYVLYRGGVEIGLSRTKAIGVGLASYVLLGGWLVASGLLAWSGAYLQGSGDVRPWLGLAAVSVLAGVLLAGRIPLVSRILAHPGTLSLLVLPNVFRIFGSTFLTVMALGHLPAVFALPAGLGDIAAGAAAPFLAWRLARGDRRGAVSFHLFGILDLAVALAIGYLAGLGPVQLIHVAPSTEALGMLPLVLVPTVAVPLIIGLHVLSLTRLHAMARAEVRHASEPLPAAG